MPFSSGPSMQTGFNAVLFQIRDHLLAGRQIFQPMPAGYSLPDPAKKIMDLIHKFIRILRVILRFPVGLYSMLTRPSHLPCFKQSPRFGQIFFRIDDGRRNFYDPCFINPCFIGLWLWWGLAYRTTCCWRVGSRQNLPITIPVIMVHYGDSSADNIAVSTICGFFDNVYGCPAFEEFGEALNTWRNRLRDVYEPQIPFKSFFPCFKISD